MDENQIKEYLADFQEKELPKLVSRHLVVRPSKKITSIIGPRRAGKTFFLYQQMRQLLEGNAKKEDIVFLNFDDARLYGINFKEIREIIKLHWRMYPASANRKLYIFIDEPQNVEDWEVAVRSLHDEGFDLFISGSSSKLLSKEIATSLRGRTIPYLLLPFSLREFLDLKGFSVVKPMDSKKKALILSYIDRYLDFGGFPEIVEEEDEQTKLRILEEYFELVVYKDIVERNKLKNTAAARWLIKALTSSYTKEFSTHKTFRTLKSMGVKISKNTLYQYLSAVEDVFYVFLLPKFSHSERGELSVSKAYLCDNSFSKLIERTPDKGKRLENAVFLELKRRQQALESISYWKNVLGEEVDFVVTRNKQVAQLIQVCWNVSDPDTKKREIKALLKTSGELGCKNLTVITEDHEESEDHEGKTIRYLPFWKWASLMKGEIHENTTD